MEAADQGRQDMAVGGMIVVVGAVEVGGHHRDVVGAVLSVQELAVLQAADLGQGVSLVGLFQLAGQQAALLHGLGSHPGIDAGRTQELQLLAAVLPGRVDDVHLQNHVVVHEVGQGFLVGHNAAHFGGCQEDVFRLLLGKELLHGILPAEVQFLVGAGNDVGIALALQLTDNGRTHHAAVARHIDFCVFLHHNWMLLLIQSAPAAGMQSQLRHW